MSVGAMAHRNESDPYSNHSSAGKSDPPAGLSPAPHSVGSDVPAIERRLPSANDQAAVVLAHWAEEGPFSGRQEARLPDQAQCALQTTGPRPTSYTPQGGDDLTKIARMFNLSVSQILKANTWITDPNAISTTKSIAIPPIELDVLYNSTALDTICQLAIATAKSIYKANYQPVPEHTDTAIPIILKQCAQRDERNADHVAYILATADHEVHFENNTREGRNRTSRDKDGTWRTPYHTGKHETRDFTAHADTKEQFDILYWDAIYGPAAKPGLGNRAGTTDARDFRGSGFVQLTGRANYQKMSDLLNEQKFTYTANGVVYGKGCNPIDLVVNFNHVSSVPELSARIMVTGMQTGMFSDFSLDDFTESREVNRHNHASRQNVTPAQALDNTIADINTQNRTTFDFVAARAVVNGNDAAQKIAVVARAFREQLGGWSQVFNQKAGGE